MSALHEGARWALVPVSAVLVVALSAGAARWAVLLVDRACPAASMVGGACVEPWHTMAVEAAIYAGIVVAVLGLVMVPSLVAPRLKRAVAAILSIIGLGAAGWVYFVTGWNELRVPVAVTALTAGLAFWWVWSRRRSDEAR